MMTGQGEGNHEDWTRGCWTRGKESREIHKGRVDRGLDKGKGNLRAGLDDAGEG
jgi:hypothetical protein